MLLTKNGHIYNLLVFFCTKSQSQGFTSRDLTKQFTTSLTVTLLVQINKHLVNKLKPLTDMFEAPQFEHGYWITFIAKSRP